MRVLAIIVLALCASTSLAAERECFTIPERYRTTGPFTAKELEAESLEFWDKRKAKLEGSIPRVPFGKGNAEWKELLARMRKGDRLLKYNEGCCTGIILVRGDCIVVLFEISLS